MRVFLGNIERDLNYAIKDINEVSDKNYQGIQEFIKEYLLGKNISEVKEFVTKYSHVFLTYKNLDELLRKKRQRFNK